MKKLILLAVIASALFSSCQKNNNPSPDAKNVPGGINAKSRPVLTTDVYVAGDVFIGANHSAAFWKNGVGTVLTGSGTGSAHGQTIAVSGTNIYVAGYDNSMDAFFSGITSGLPCVWKNGVEQLLPIPSGHTGGAQSIAVSGSDVYVVGYYITNDATHSRRAMLWKNGVAQLLSFNNFDSVATGIALDGADVYICGNAVFTGITCAVYWKNKIWHPFAGTTVTSRAASIAVDSRHNYYISGSSNNHGCYWKDANLVALTSDNYFPGARSNDCFFGNMISVNNSNVYVSGLTVISADGEHAEAEIAYWKNGQVFVNNTATGDELDSGGPQSIVVINNTVYMDFMRSDLVGNFVGYAIDNTVFPLDNFPQFIGGMAVVQH